MIYVFLGKEINIINKNVNELISILNIDNIIKYDFNDVSINDILDEVCYVDLFNEKKLLIISNFTFKKIKEKEEKRFIKYIENLNDNVIIFKCIDEKVDDRKNITKLLKEKCKLNIIPKLDYKALHQYITNMFKTENKKITYDQVKRILNLCENNADITINEVEKLLLYKLDEDTIYDEDIENVISKSSEKEMFTLIDKVMSKNIGGCFDSFKILINANIDAIVILDNLAKQFRTLYQIKELKKTMDDISISRTLKINIYTLQKMLPYLNRYSENDIANILLKLSDIDSDIKINGFDKNEAIESFFISL